LIAKKDKKEWEKYSPVGDLGVLLVDLSVYDLEKFKLEVIANLCNDRYHFCKFIELLISRRDIKWQAIIANSRRYGPKKFVFLNCDQDFNEFVEAVYEAINSKATIKLVMDDPQGKAKQLEHVSVVFHPDRVIMLC
jgi:hypothetical protein